MKKWYIYVRVPLGIEIKSLSEKEKDKYWMMAMTDHCVC